jgi:hypothetical protein
LSVFDDITVVENNLLTKDLTVKGTTTIEGDLNVLGTIPESSPLFVRVVTAATHNVKTSLDESLFKRYADTVSATIKKDGLDLTKITIDGKELVDGNSLGNFVVNSNLQKLGHLKELQVAGESFLGDTLYVSNKRVGINTLEPNNALSIWDQEIEIGAGKLSSNTAFFGTTRTQTLVLSSNGKTNLSLTPDGGVTISALKLGSVTISASDMPPSDNKPKGTIVFNANPTLGGPLGWVSLGDARWANFGIID